MLKKTNGCHRYSPSSRTTTLDKQPKRRSLHIHELQQPSRSPGNNPIDNLWKNLKIAVYGSSSTTLTDLEIFCNRKITNILFSGCSILVEHMPKNAMPKSILHIYDFSKKHNLENFCVYEELCVRFSPNRKIRFASIY